MLFVTLIPTWMILAKESSSLDVGDALFCAFLYAAGFVSLYFRHQLALEAFLETFFKIIGFLFFATGLLATFLIPFAPKDYITIGTALYCAVLYAAGFAVLYFRNRLANGE